MKEILFIVSLTIAVAIPLEWKKEVEKLNMLYSFNRVSERYSPAIGNGYLATVIGTYNLYISGVYNGVLTDQSNPSHRARVPSPLNISVLTVDGKSVCPEKNALDLQHGIFYQRYKNQSIEEEFFVHRSRKNLLVYALKSLNGKKKVCLKSDPGVPSPDIDFSPISQFVINSTEEPPKKIQIYLGHTQITELEGLPKIPVVLATWEPENQQRNPEWRGKIFGWQHCVEISEEKPFVVFSVIKDSATPKEVQEIYLQAIEINYKKILEEHKLEWNKLRENGASIQIKGFPEISRAVNASIYELLVSMREEDFWSNSPGGLATNNYNGHIFWDFESWMFPSLLLMYPNLAKNGLLYRANHIQGAFQKLERITIRAQCGLGNLLTQEMRLLPPGLVLGKWRIIRAICFILFVIIWYMLYLFIYLN